MAPRRSDPKQLDKNRKQIAEQKYNVEMYGKATPNLFDKLGRTIQERADARYERKYPSARRAGAAQKGFKPTSTGV